MKNVLIKLLNILIYILGNIANKLSQNKQVQITSLNYNKNGRFLIYHLANSNLNTHKDILRGIYTTLMNNERFINFPYKKIILITAINHDSTEFNYHHNVLITNQTSFYQYYNSVKDVIMSSCNDPYPLDNITAFKVWV